MGTVCSCRVKKEGRWDSFRSAHLMNYAVVGSKIAGIITELAPQHAAAQDGVALESTIGQDVPSTSVTAAVHFKRGLVILLEASRYAAELGRDAWDFAVEIVALREGGLNHSDLRWLICKGWVEHSREVLVRGRKGREFCHGASLTLTKRSCFVLTSSGIRSAECLPPPVEVAPTALRAPVNSQNPTDSQSPLPKWDRDRQELRLRLNGEVVKEFRLPSPNQETVLMAFEEEGWPPRIDDPLPQHSGVDPKRRLHDTIKSLNRNQKRGRMRFMGDGTGEGGRWRAISLQEEENELTEEGQAS
jgi:hypothetical protein